MKKLSFYLIFCVSEIMLFLLGAERYRLKGFFGFSSSELPLIYKIADVTKL